MPRLTKSENLKVHELLRAQHARTFEAHSGVFEDAPENSHQHRSRQRAVFGATSKSERISLLRALLRRDDFDASVTALLRGKLARLLSEGKPSETVFLNAGSCLLTYQGPWGVMPSGLPGPVEELQCFIEALRTRRDVCALWAECLDHVQKSWKEKLLVMRWSAALELCEETLRDSGVLRLHLHIFLEMSKKALFSSVS
jgi:hypothetical protein